MTLEQLADLTPGIVTAFALLSIFSEYIILLKKKKVSMPKEGRVSLASAGLAFFPLFILNKFFLIAFMFWLYEWRFFDFGFQWYAWIIAWVFYDFMFWIVHWLGHNVRLVWCLHSVHHTPKEMNLSVAFRGSFFDFLAIPHTTIWLPLFGFHPFMALIVETVGRLYGILVHVNTFWFPNKRRSWIEKLIISPSAHRVHHCTNAIYLDRNYGETLSIWDYIFGTYQDELSKEKPKYGVMKEVNSESLIDTQTHELKSLWSDIKSCSSLSDKFKYLYMPPGWKHTGDGELAFQIRERALRELKSNDSR